MSDFDHEHVSHLLNIVAQCAGHSGKLGAISNEAMHELLELNDKMHVQGTERRKRAEAKKAEEKIAHDRKVAADNEANQPKSGPKVIAAQPSEEEKIAADNDRLREEEIEHEAEDDGTIKPSVFPADSQTATIADRRM
jgi:hypothetical protein